MEEESSSWIRRTKFSHTIYHRFDLARLPSIPITIEPNRNKGLKSRPTVTQIQRNPATNKQRSVSPLPETTLSDAFKEARSDRKRFSTPHPQRKEPDKQITGKLSHRDSRQIWSHDSKKSSTSPLRPFSSMKVHDKNKRQEGFDMEQVF